MSSRCQPTCFKSDSPTCIDLILTSDKKQLANIRAVETRLSDFHAMVLTTLKGNFHKRGPRIITYGDDSKLTTIRSERRSKKS